MASRYLEQPREIILSETNKISNEGIRVAILSVLEAE